VQVSVISLEEATCSSQLVPVGKHPVKTTIDQYMAQKSEQAKHPCNLDLQKRFDLELITMTTTNCSYNFVDQEGFKHFMHYVAPKFTVKGKHSKSKFYFDLKVLSLQKLLKPQRQGSSLFLDT